MRVTLRPIALADAPSVQRYAADERLARTCNVPHPYPDNGGAWFAKRSVDARAKRERFPFAVLVDDDFAGIVGLNAPDFENRTIECDYWIGVPFWGKGIGTAAVGLAAAYAFADLDMQIVFSGCLTSNPASARVLEKNGFMEIETIVNDGKYGLNPDFPTAICLFLRAWTLHFPAHLGGR